MKFLPFLAIILFSSAFSAAEDLKTYDENWNLKYKVEDGRIYDRD